MNEIDWMQQVYPQYLYLPTSEQGLTFQTDDHFRSHHRQIAKSRICKAAPSIVHTINFL
jgi:hypothetical protein